MNRIKVIIPVSSNRWNVPVKQLMDRYKNADTEIEVVNLAKGPVSIECAYDEVMAEMFALEEAEKAQEEGFDGVIIYCGTDPGVRAAKEKLDIPVVGIGETSYHLASMLGSSFSIIAVAQSSLLSTRRRLMCDHLKLYGLEHKCSSVRTLDIPVSDLDKEKVTQVERILVEARKAIEEDGADTIVLGCGALLGVEEQISNELRVPVIVPGIAALKISESLIQIDLKQSKRCFGTPAREKARVIGKRHTA